MNIRAVIWDLDGTLLDTLGDLAASTNAALQKNGLPQRGRPSDPVAYFICAMSQTISTHLSTPSLPLSRQMS